MCYMQLHELETLWEDLDVDMQQFDNDAWHEWLW